MLEYSVGFPVNPQDLQVFVNGKAIFDYTFKQSNNSVVLNPGSAQDGDRLMFRTMKDLV